MSSNEYIDQYSRTWHKIIFPANGKHWLMLTSHDGYTPGNFKVGGYYSDAELSKHAVVLNRVVKGAAYEFPPALKSGDSVWIDEQWFESDASSRTKEWIGCPGRIGGKIENINLSGSTAIVTVAINVPLSKITQQ